MTDRPYWDMIYQTIDIYISQRGRFFMARPTTEYVCAFCGRKSSDFPDMQFYQSEKIEKASICQGCFQTLVKTAWQDLIKVIEEGIAAEETVETPEAEPAGESVKEPVTEPGETLSVEQQSPIRGLPLDRQLPRPDEIKAYLDEYIIGQENAKEILSVAAYNHYKLLRYEALHKSDKQAVDIHKSNLLMCGPSGVGKTATIKRLAEFLEVPVAICDCAGLSKTGYTGRDPSSIIFDLLRSADDDFIKAEGGIVYLDEFDKLACSNDPVNQDITGEGVQQELLKLIEGTTMEIPKRLSEELVLPVTFDTKRILFICGGAFDGLENIVRRRLGQVGNRRPIGFGQSSEPAVSAQLESDVTMAVTTEDFRRYGIIPELLGRLPVICPLQALTRVELVQILTKPKDSLVRQYETLLAMDGAHLTVTKGALAAIADEAIRCKTGARGLRSMLERLLSPTMYYVPKLGRPVRVVITKACVTRKKQALIKEKASHAIL